MDKYMKKGDVIAYIRNEAKEAQNESHGYGRQARGNPAKTEAHVQAQGRAASYAGSRAENDPAAASCGANQRRYALWAITSSSR